MTIRSSGHRLKAVADSDFRAEVIEYIMFDPSRYWLATAKNVSCSITADKSLEFARLLYHVISSAQVLYIDYSPSLRQRLYVISRIYHLSCAVENILLLNFNN